MAWWPFKKKQVEGDEKQEELTRTPEESAEDAEREVQLGAFARLKRGLQKTAAGLKQILGGQRRIDEELLEELEVKMYEADFGPDMVAELLEELRVAWQEKRIQESNDLAPFLKERFLQHLTARDRSVARAADGPTVILVAGVNGTGKTTSIAKLSHWLGEQGNTVMLAAADTFRAAATEQLQIWSERINLPIVTGEGKKKDPAAVAFTACERARAENIDYLVVDTAGRLHTQTNLMRELEKVRRVIAKQIPGAPHEVLLVLDATTGQNALSQAEAFNASIDLNGLIMAKLDGTAKGGVLITLNNRFNIPVKFVGLGEKVTDWAEFSPERFVEALFDEA